MTISAPGSYRLTSDLSVSASNVSAITITGLRARIDLGGFEVSGPGSCTGLGSSLVCTGAGTAVGIQATSTPAFVQNGSVRGFAAGLNLAGGIARSLRVEENAGIGIGGASAIDVEVERNGFGISISVGYVRDSIVVYNKGIGISVLGSHVTGCVLYGNGGAGISGYGSLVAENVLTSNQSLGIYIGGGIIRNNVVSGSTQDGIVANAGSLAVGNTSQSIGGAGIAALSAGSVLENVVRDNTGVGLYLVPEQGGPGGPAASYRGNVVIEATGGTVTSGINQGNNTCNASASCP